MNKNPADATASASTWVTHSII